MKSVFPRMHVSLYVQDIQETIAFYDRFFGQSATKTKTDYAKYLLDSPSLIISFVQNPDRVSPGFGHLGFQVETVEELESRLTLARELGLVRSEERDTACCYAVQDKFWVEDPDGYRWEVYLFKEDAAFNDPRYYREREEVCCTPREQKASGSLSQICRTPVDATEPSCC